MRLKAAAAYLLIYLALAAAHPHAQGLTPSAGDAVLIDSNGSVTARIYNATRVTEDILTEVNATLRDGLPVVFIGEGAERLLEVAGAPITLEDLDGVAAAGVWLHPGQPGAPISVLLVRDSFYSPECLEAAYRWLEEPVEAPSGNLSDLYRLVAVLTEVDRQLPLGVLETRTEVLRVLDASGFNLIDLTVNQMLTPGSAAGVSGWMWSSLEYAVDGSAAGANVTLSSYDEPPREPPVGIFTLLWRIVTLRWADIIPWLWGQGQGVAWTDMSDYGRQLYQVRIEAPDGSAEAGEPLEARHHVVLKAAEGADPVYLRWTQVRYVKGGALSAERYTAPATGGLIRVHT
ncbi:MAG: hypothetical protein ABIJ47_06755 [Candidatus Bathyarchaeota archaeon]